MRIKRAFIFGFSACLCVFLCLKAEDALYAAKDALVLCAERVIPPLFPFFVLSSFMVNIGFVASAGRLIAPMAKRVFQVSGSGAVVFLMGLLCGYPTGAKMVAELYQEGQITKREAERLLPFCNNSGPLFIMGAVGSMLGDFDMARLVFIIHALSAFLVGIFFSFGAKQKESEAAMPFSAISFGDALSKSVSRAVETMLLVCGYIVFFAVLRAFLQPMLARIFSDGAIGLTVRGMLEVTLGAREICAARLSAFHTFVSLCSVIGFGGVCVLLQVWGIVNRAGLSLKTYALGKLLQMGISALLAVAFFRFFKTVPVFCGAALSVKTFPDIGMLLFVAALIVCAFDKRFTVWYLNDRKQGWNIVWQKRVKY